MDQLERMARSASEDVRERTNKCSRCKASPILRLELTLSSALPFSTLSVVACTLPPFLWRSHIMVRLSNCGNIDKIWSACAGFICRVGTELELEGERNHRMARKPTSTTAMI